LDHSLTSQSARSLQVPPSNRQIIVQPNPHAHRGPFVCAPLPEFPGGESYDQKRMHRIDFHRADKRQPLAGSS
jgi:hypothetical protein